MKRKKRGGRAGSKAGKRFDPAALREVLGVGADVQSALGVVVAGEDGAAYDLDVVGGQVREITVEQQLVPAGGRVTARVAAGGGSPLRGVFGLPEIGDEYMVHFVGGDRSNAIAASPLSGARYPASAQQATGGKILVIGVEVILTNAAGGGEEPLVRKSEFEAHIHGTGTGPSATPTSPITGTTVVKGK